MSYILFIDSEKRLRKFLSVNGKEEVRNCFFFAPSEELNRKDFPKKANVKFLQLLLPNPKDATEMILKKDKDKFRKKLLLKLTSPLCKAALNKIVKTCYLDDYNVIVCFGEVERDFGIPKYIRQAIEMIYPNLDVFTWKDYKDDPEAVVRYKPENRSDIVEQIIDDAAAIGRALKDLESCRDDYDSQIFYDD